MSCRRFLKQLLIACAALPALAAVQTVQPFGTATWYTLSQAPQQATAVVFSTTDCSHCPGVIANLSKQLRHKARLTVVVMDGAGQEQALLHDPHLRPADALYAFAGDEMQLRYGVNPGWRGLTPYVVLLAPGREAQYHTGAPPMQALQGWLAR